MWNTFDIGKVTITIGTDVKDVNCTIVYTIV